MTPPVQQQQQQQAATTAGPHSADGSEQQQSEEAAEKVVHVQGSAGDTDEAARTGVLYAVLITVPSLLLLLLAYLCRSHRPCRHPAPKSSTAPTRPTAKPRRFKLCCPLLHKKATASVSPENSVHGAEPSDTPADINSPRPAGPPQ